MKLSVEGSLTPRNIFRVPAQSFLRGISRPIGARIPALLRIDWSKMIIRAAALSLSYHIHGIHVPLPCFQIPTNTGGIGGGDFKGMV